MKPNTKTTRRLPLSFALARVGLAGLLLAWSGGRAARAELPIAADGNPLDGSSATSARAVAAPDGDGDGGAAPPASREPSPSSGGDHPSPRLKLARRTFSIGNVDGTALPLSAIEVDLYPVSGRWVRGGITAAAGKGQGEMSGKDVSLRYGMAGVSAGVQLPARVTPFVEANLWGGLLEGSLDSAAAIPGTSLAISGGSAVTWIYGRGVDVGAELYAVGRLYVSGSIGWLRTTWRGPDAAAMAQAPAAGLVLRDLTADGLTFKLGVGI